MVCIATCALVTGGRPKCWGLDSSGQLGHGTVWLWSSLTPVDVVDPGLSINYRTGQPGSYLTLTGVNYPPGRPLTVTVNGQLLTTTLRTNETGEFIFFVSTTGADAGGYVVTASVNADTGAAAQFVLDPHAPVRPQEGGGDTLPVPAGIAVQFRFIYLPVIRR